MIEHHDMNSNNSYILSFKCPDKVGVVAATTAFFYDHGAFITEVANYSDPVSETFHMRCVFDDRQMNLSFDEFSEKFQIIAQDFENPDNTFAFCQYTDKIDGGFFRLCSRERN